MTVKGPDGNRRPGEHIYVKQLGGSDSSAAREEFINMPISETKTADVSESESDSYMTKRLKSVYVLL